METDASFSSAVDFSISSLREWALRAESANFSFSRSRSIRSCGRLGLQHKVDDELRSKFDDFGIVDLSLFGNAKEFLRLQIVFDCEQIFFSSRPVIRR